MEVSNITEEIIDKCLSFCEGKRGGLFTLNNIKNENFPKNLITGNEMQANINSMRSKGYTYNRIAAELGCSRTTVMQYVEHYHKGEEFYHEWLDFWAFIRPLRRRKLVELLLDVLTPGQLAACHRNGVDTLEDFLRIFATCSVSVSAKKACRMNSTEKAQVFAAIRAAVLGLIDGERGEAEITQQKVAGQISIFDDDKQR